MKIEYWSDYKLIETLSWPKGYASFVQFYDLNNSLKYCNGSHYKFVEEKDREEYINVFMPKHHTIENYYKGGIVD